MKRLKGFTLVELVITIAIVIILSVVSVPIYRSYSVKAKLSEAYALLGVILSAQKAYYSEYGMFASHGNWTAYHPVLGIDARGNKYFSWFCAQGSLNNNNSKLGYCFFSGISMPNSIKQERDDNSNALCLEYNVTSGQTIFWGWV